jgi:hypothetical protein
MAQDIDIDTDTHTFFMGWHLILALFYRLDVPELHVLLHYLVHPRMSGGRGFKGILGP